VTSNERDHSFGVNEVKNIKRALRTNMLGMTVKSI